MIPVSTVGRAGKDPPQIESSVQSPALDLVCSDRSPIHTEEKNSNLDETPSNLSGVKDRLLTQSSKGNFAPPRSDDDGGDDDD
eukprot:CAMPEP_0171810174 /NCGR_PEP_ID=MMETSP0991-20121206/77385_1 /TAXON_ID=483369 /ORGANISM="non described non described, Strain CCMP2098" /LENGTH=82 /DNA_ID=CAMNT_0012423359 /DNA_START=63 /DNA_END=308 /DNA_ORIENTATION=+